MFRYFQTEHKLLLLLWLLKCFSLIYTVLNVIRSVAELVLCMVPAQASHCHFLGWLTPSSRHRHHFLLAVMTVGDF